MAEHTIVITGSSTEVGKTWVGVALAQALRDEGVRVAARKPVQSHAPGDRDTDARLLAGATGEDPDFVCHPSRGYPLALAPPIAARRLGADIPTIAEMAAELRLVEAEVLLVEGAGGPRSPLARDGDTADLITALEPETVVLVVDAALGLINAVLTSASAAGGDPVVFLNRFDASNEVHSTSLEWLQAHEPLRIETTINGLTAAILPRPSTTPEATWSTTPS